MRVLHPDPRLVGGEEIAHAEVALAVTYEELQSMVLGIGEAFEVVTDWDFEALLGFASVEVASVACRLRGIRDLVGAPACPWEDRLWLIEGFPPRRGTRLLYPDLPWTGEIQLGGEELADGEVPVAATRDDLLVASASLRLALDEIEEWEFNVLFDLTVTQAARLRDRLREIVEATAPDR
jgi:hypothetical protein